MSALLILILVLLGYVAGVITTRWISKPRYCARCRRHFALEDDFYDRRGLPRPKD